MNEKVSDPLSSMYIFANLNEVLVIIHVFFAQS